MEKTWLLRELGHEYSKNVAYIGLDSNPGLAIQFEAGFDTERLLSVIQVETGQTATPGKTLIIFDEIQVYPLALTMLEYFRENIPDWTITTAGLLLGIIFHRGSGFPVGKADMLNPSPLSFREFLDATGGATPWEVVDLGSWQILGSSSNKL